MYQASGRFLLAFTTKLPPTSSVDHGGGGWKNRNSLAIPRGRVPQTAEAHFPCIGLSQPKGIDEDRVDTAKRNVRSYLGCMVYELDGGVALVRSYGKARRDVGNMDLSGGNFFRSSLDGALDSAGTWNEAMLGSC